VPPVSTVAESPAQDKTIQPAAIQPTPISLQLKTAKLQAKLTIQESQTVVAAISKVDASQRCLPESARHLGLLPSGFHH